MRIPATPSDRAQGRALAWAAAVTGVEWAARRTFRRRSTAWIISYVALGSAAVAAGARLDRIGQADARRQAIWGVALASAGYPLGRLLLGDRPTSAPPEEALRETVAIAGIVAPAEELAWGQLVEPELGLGATASLFAVKHPLVDGRWGRTVGLALSWYGLGLVRRASPLAALGLHVGNNAIGVLMGRISGQDQF
jgi:hypothetical protein